MAGKKLGVKGVLKTMIIVFIGLIVVNIIFALAFSLIQQESGKKYMATVTDEEIKGIVINKFPKKYSLQKVTYDLQYNAKQYMALVDDEELKELAKETYPNDYYMQKYFYDRENKKNEKDPIDIPENIIAANIPAQETASTNDTNIPFRFKNGTVKFYFTRFWGGDDYKREIETIYEFELTFSKQTFTQIKRITPARRAKTIAGIHFDARPRWEDIFKLDKNMLIKTDENYCYIYMEGVGAYAVLRIDRNGNIQFKDDTWIDAHLTSGSVIVLD